MLYFFLFSCCVIPLESMCTIASGYASSLNQAVPFPLKHNLFLKKYDILNPEIIGLSVIWVSLIFRHMTQMENSSRKST
jgi:hypothetical protein